MEQQRKIYRYYSPDYLQNRVVIVGEFKDNKWQFACARTSKKDRYVKKIGRSIAEGRLKNGKYCFVTLPKYSEPEISTFVYYAEQLTMQISLTAKITLED
jgi:hypothetical protein